MDLKNMFPGVKAKYTPKRKIAGYEPKQITVTITGHPYDGAECFAVPTDVGLIRCIDLIIDYESVKQIKSQKRKKEIEKEICKKQKELKELNAELRNLS